MKYVLLFLISLFLVQTAYAKEEILYPQGKKDRKEGAISWYAKGLKNPEKLTTACWADYPKGTKFRITYNGNSVVVVCNDRGHFRKMGRVLDLSSGAFRNLAPLKFGIIRGAKVEVIK